MMRTRTELTPEQRLDQHYVALGHSVELINNTIAAATDISQVDEVVKRMIDRNVHHLKVVMERETWNPLIHNLDGARAAIAAGEAFLAQFPA
jgi:hypothetical protein